MLGAGTFFNIGWMVAVAGGYLAFLWLPISPEKVVTVAIALFLVRKLFPKHNQELEADILAVSGKDGSKRKKKEPTDEPKEQGDESL